MLRRQRGGQKLLLEHLWPKLELIVSVDYRITTTGLYSDYILPAAQHYEKLGHGMPSVHHLNFVLCDRAAPPPNQATPSRTTRSECGFSSKIEERAKPPAASPSSPTCGGNREKPREAWRIG